MGQFFELSYQNISGNNQVKIFFLELVAFQFKCPHAQLKGRSHKKIRGRSILVTAMLNFLVKENTSIHRLGEDDMATI